MSAVSATSELLVAAPFEPRDAGQIEPEWLDEVRDITAYWQDSAVPMSYADAIFSGAIVAMTETDPQVRRNHLVSLGGLVLAHITQIDRTMRERAA